MHDWQNLRLNSEIIVEGIRYCIIGIDSYNLKHFLDGTTQWQSFTLSAGGEQMAWISHNEGDNFFVRWTAMPKSAFVKAIADSSSCVLNLKLSGMAHISFTGYRGLSLPFAETICYDIIGEKIHYHYLASERFLELCNQTISPQDSIYMNGRILEANAVNF